MSGSELVLTGVSATRKNRAATPARGTLRRAGQSSLSSAATTTSSTGATTSRRLTLQTLINTYPDSEYLAKAKLAIADSYYKEGGTAGLDASRLSNTRISSPSSLSSMKRPTRRCKSPWPIIARWKNRTAITPKPKSAKKNSRFSCRISAKPACSASRAAASQRAGNSGRWRFPGRAVLLHQIRLPRFRWDACSKSPAAIRSTAKPTKTSWMFAGIYDRNEKTQFAGAFYSHIVNHYPLSPLVPQPKRLTKLGLPVPQADPNAIARMTRNKIPASADRLVAPV